MYILSPEAVNLLVTFIGGVIIYVLNHMRLQRAEKRNTKRQNEADTRSAENKQSIEEVKTKLADTEEALGTAQSSIRELQQKNADKEREIGEMRVDLGKKDQENLAHGNAITRLLEENAQANDRIKVLETTAKEASQTVEELRKEMTAVTGERNNAVTQLAEANRRIGELERQVHDQDEKIKEQSVRLYDQDVKIKAFDMVFTRLQIIVTAPAVEPPKADGPALAATSITAPTGEPKESEKPQ